MLMLIGSWKMLLRDCEITVRYDSPQKGDGTSRLVCPISVLRRFFFLLTFAGDGFNDWPLKHVGFENEERRGR